MALEEYRALRQESLRCAAVLSNAVWLAVSAFALTIGGALAASAKGALPPAAIPLLAVALAVQSTAAAGMYLQELWRYARIGKYIRFRIERGFSYREFSKSPSPRTRQRPPGEWPMYWEHWIGGNRATSYYIISVIIIQLPVAIILMAMTLAWGNQRYVGWPESVLTSTGDILLHDGLETAILLTAITLDAFLTFYMSWKLLKRESDDESLGIL